MLKGVFVDFGNTLVSDEEDRKLHLLFSKDIKEKYHLPKEPEEIRDFLSAFVRGGLYNSHIRWPGLLNLYSQAFTLLLNTHGIIAKREDTEYFKKLFIDYHARYSVFFENSIETLTEFKDMGLYVGMISDNDNVILNAILNANGIRDIFQHIVTSEDVGVGKPNKKIFEKALSLASLEPEETVYIGNSYFHDVEGAKNMGIKPLHFTKEFKTWNEIKKHIVKIMGDV